MKKIRAVAGERYGLFEIIKELPTQVRNYTHGTRRVRMVLCLCDCGTKKTIRLSDIDNGHTKSCGCLRIKMIKERETNHGMCKSSEYYTWSSMGNRCNNKNDPSHYRYGGRGISICKRWQKFKNFYEDMGDKPAPGYSIDRIDNNGNYEPDNCRWATVAQQANNQRTNVLIEHNGKTQNMKQWSSELGINYQTLVSRFKNGWSIERVLKTN